MRRLTQISRRSERRVVKVVLSGGLGNQLFQYFAGLHVAHRTHSQLQIDSTFSQRGRTGHSDFLGVLDLPGVFSRDAPRSSPQFLTSYFRRILRGVTARLIKSPRMRIKFLHQYRPSEVGFDPEVESLKPPVTLIGYFQTWRFYRSLSDSGVAPELRTTKYSEWYLETLKLLAGQARVLGLHIRRGDYVGNPTIGVLSSSYYEEAILRLKDHGVDWDAVWVFSDDVIGAKNALRSVLAGYSKVHFVEPPAESHAFESLLLMSKTSVLVIANSTFSWWAATLGVRSRVIVRPDKWFAVGDDPIDLCPADWLSVPASWLEK